jgi:hypothetical protein
MFAWICTKVNVRGIRMEHEEVKKMIIENFIDYFTSDDKEREQMKECLTDYMEGEKADGYDELGDDDDRYRKAYDILMEYWDCIPDEEKPEVDRKLNELGL